jgi:hypothetical protein
MLNLEFAMHTLDASPRKQHSSPEQPTAEQDIPNAVRWAKTWTMTPPR